MTGVDSSNRASVFVVDDDEVAAAYLVGVAQSGGYRAEKFASAEEFLQRADATARGCVLLDLQMAGMNGLQLQGELQQRGLRWPVIIVSGSAEVSSAVTAMKQDAFDFFEKPVDPVKLLETIARAVQADQSGSVKRGEDDVIRGRYATLSPRERQVMGMVVQGLANKQMAAQLSLSEKTVEVHRGNVMRKMQVDSVAALVRASLVCGGNGS